MDEPSKDGAYDVSRHVPVVQPATTDPAVRCELHESSRPNPLDPVRVKYTRLVVPLAADYGAAS